MIKTSIDAADAAAKTAQSLGITTEALTGLQFAAELSGVNNEKLSDAFKDLNKNIFDASQGAKSQADAFKSLGVSVTDSNGNLRSADSVLLDIADRFAESADGADKTAIAMRVFGESGRTLIPLLNSGSDGIEQLTARAEELGLVIDSNTAKSAERFNDNLTVFQATTRGLSNAIATAMLPTLENLSGELVRIGDEANFATEAASFLVMRSRCWSPEAWQSSPYLKQLAMSLAAQQQQLYKPPKVISQNPWRYLMMIQRVRASRKHWLGYLGSGMIPQMLH